MNIDDIITHLRTSPTTSAIFGNRVSGAAEFAAIEDRTVVAMPALFVVPMGAAAGESTGLNALYQDVTETFEVISVTDNTANRRGQDAITASVDTIRWALLKALLNWRLDKELAPRGIQFVGERKEFMDAARFFYVYEFRQVIQVNGAEHGWREPDAAWATTSISVVTADSTDPADERDQLARVDINMNPGS